MRKSSKVSVIFLVLTLIAQMLCLTSITVGAATPVPPISFDDWNAGTTANGTFAVPSGYASLFTSRANSDLDDVLEIVSKNAADNYLKMNFGTANSQGFWLNLPSPYQTTGKQTISFDVYLTLAEQAGGLAVNIYTSGSQQVSRYSILSSRIANNVDGGSVYYSTNPAITGTGINTWMNVAYVLDPVAKTFDVYINNQLLTTKDYRAKASMTADEGAMMVQFYNNAGGGATANEVWIDNLQVYESEAGEVPQFEIHNNFNTETTGTLPTPFVKTTSNGAYEGVIDIASNSEVADSKFLQVVDVSGDATFVYGQGVTVPFTEINGGKFTAAMKYMLPSDYANGLGITQPESTVGFNFILTGKVNGSASTVAQFSIQRSSISYYDNSSGSTKSYLIENHNSLNTWVDLRLIADLERKVVNVFINEKLYEDIPFRFTGTTVALNAFTVFSDQKMSYQASAVYLDDVYITNRAVYPNNYVQAHIIRENFNTLTAQTFFTVGTDAGVTATLETKLGSDKYVLYTDGSAEASTNNALSYILAAARTDDTVFELDFLKPSDNVIEVSLLDESGAAGSIVSISGTAITAGGSSVAVIETAQWYNLKLVIKPSNGTLDIYKDNLLLVSGATFDKANVKKISFAGASAATLGVISLDNFAVYGLGDGIVSGVQVLNTENTDITFDSAKLDVKKIILTLTPNADLPIKASTVSTDTVVLVTGETPTPISVSYVPATKSVEITALAALKFGKTYAVDFNGIEDVLGNAIVTTYQFDTATPPNKYTTYIGDAAGNKISTVAAGGPVYGYVVVNNSLDTVPQVINGKIILAVYNNNALYDIKTQDLDVEAGVLTDYIGIGETLPTELTGDISVKLFIWDDYSLITPLTEYKEVNNLQ